MGMITVEVNDQFGGYIKGTKEIVTGFIMIDMYNGRSGEKDLFMLDPGEKESTDWLKKVFQPIHLEILLGEA